MLEKQRPWMRVLIIIGLSFSIMACGACGLCNLSVPEDLLAEVEDMIDGFTGDEVIEVPAEEVETEEEMEDPIVPEEEPEVEEEVSETEPVEEEPEKTVPEGSMRSKAPEGDFQILSYTTFLDDDWLYVVGEVRNNSPDAKEYVEIIITALDEAGAEISTMSAYSMLNALDSGDISPFMMSTDEWADADSFTFEVDAFDGEAAEKQIELTFSDTYVESDWLHIIGEVENTSSDAAQSWVSVVVTLLDDNDQVINAVYNYVMKDFLNPGESSPFELLFTENWEDFTKMEIKLEGDEAEIQDPILELISAESYQENDWCYVSGEIKNIGTEQYDLAQIIVGFYDAEDTLVGTTWTFADVDELKPGETSPFDTTTSHCPGYDHHKIFLEE